VALTFDDGPDPQWTPPLLEVLRRHQACATFFVVGERVRQYPEIAQRIVLAGHALGNHTMRHPRSFAGLPPNRIREEIQHAQDAVIRATGQAPRLFRAPAGNWSRTVLRLADEAGLQPVDWSIDVKDWHAPPARHIFDAMLRSRPGDIVLCHDGGGDRSATITAVQAALPALRGRGLAFTTLKRGFPHSRLDATLAPGLPSVLSR